MDCTVAGYYVADPYCLQCNLSCATCSSSTTHCLTCPSSTYLTTTNENVLQAALLDPFVTPRIISAIVIRTIIDCDLIFIVNFNPSCKTCVDAGPQSCTACSQTNYYIAASTDRTCMDCTVAGFYLADPYCLKCDSSCATCSSTATNCLTCSLTSNNTCAEYCPDEDYPNITDNATVILKFENLN